MLAVPDCHYPYVDPVAMAKLQLLNKKKKFKNIVFLGDLLENDIFSRYEKDPRLETSFAETLAILDYDLTTFRKNNKNARMLVKFGNHDERLFKYALKHAPTLVKTNVLKSLHEIINLDKNKIESWGYNDRLVLDGLKITHGTIVRQLSGYSAHAELRKAGDLSGISGHTHRLGYVTYRGKTWLECGHLCTNDTSKFLYLADGEADWQQGFAVGKLVEWCNEGQTSRQWIMEPIKITNGSFIVDGVLY